MSINVEIIGGTLMWAALQPVETLGKRKIISFLIPCQIFSRCLAGRRKALHVRWEMTVRALEGGRCGDLHQSRFAPRATRQN